MTAGTTAVDMLKQGRRDELWRKYCGFLDLSLDEFMAVQERLLMEQTNLLSRCELGRQLLGNRVPSSVKEFREQVPVTTYKDYLPFLVDRDERVLPARPAVWARTSGRSSEYSCKWAPYSPQMVSKVGEFAVASFLLASCSDRGDVRLDVGDTYLYTLAPPPYFNGAVVAKGLAELVDPTFVPPLGEGDQMSFEQRVAEGFKLALSTGIDFFYGLSSVLVAVGRQFAQGGGGNMQLSRDVLRPASLGRLLKALLKTKLTGSRLLPREIWKLKGIVAGGMDTGIYKSLIGEYWGKMPLEGYGGTELGGVALQAWNYQGMTFLPDSNYYEFIPEEYCYGSNGHGNAAVPTCTLADVKPGVYELVITNFHGGVFTRYRTGDMVEIMSLGDRDLNIRIPQMAFYARVDGVIDVGGFTRLTEKAILQAVQESGVPYVDWTVRKEYPNKRPILHLYLEPKNGVTADDARKLIHQRLKEKDPGYADLEGMLGLDPLTVTLLPCGAFARYTEARKLAGAELAHLKPKRIEPPEKVLEQLLRS